MDKKSNLPCAQGIEVVINYGNALLDYGNDDLGTLNGKYLFSITLRTSRIVLENRHIMSNSWSNRQNY